MKRRGWSPEEEGELEMFCADAHAAAGTQPERITALVELLERALATNTRWVRAVEAEGRRLVASALLRDYASTRRPVLHAVTPDGLILDKPRASATIKRDDDGAEYIVQELFDYKTWDELGRELRKSVGLERSQRTRTLMITRLLELHDKVPTAKNPAEALEHLGIDMQAWLDADGVAS